jgi:predicted RNA-binding protein YlqC (UPF0109 family)
VKKLLLLIAQALVDQPEKVEVLEVQGSQCTILELKVAKSEIGKVIGKHGHTAQAIRTILNTAAAKIKKRIVLEILEEKNEAFHFDLESRRQTIFVKAIRKLRPIEYHYN